MTMTKLRNITVNVALIIALQLAGWCNGFLASPSGISGILKPSISAPLLQVSSTAATAGEEEYVEAIPMLSSVTDPEAIKSKDDLLQLAQDTRKGFSSTPSQKKRAREIITNLARFNPTLEPAAPYYDDISNENDDDTKNSTTTTNVVRTTGRGVSLEGKWDLIYTDAPDITSLDTSWNPLATAKLGRIGQECNPPYIKNVIEWKKPDWVDQVPLPFAGNKESRILQKVCTKASASREKPMLVNLEVVGLDLVAPPLQGGGTTTSGTGRLQDDIEQEGLPVGLLRNNPLELRGPLTAPFGQFEVLYLDEEMRIIRTYQNYVAVNLRSQEEWY